MVKIYEFKNNEFFRETFYKTKIFKYLHALKQSDFLDFNEYMAYCSIIEKKMLMIEHDVSRSDIISQLKTRLKPNVTEEEINAIIDDKLFNYDKVSELVLEKRILENATKTSEKIKKGFLEILEGILNE